MPLNAAAASCPQPVTTSGRNVQVAQSSPFTSPGAIGNPSALLAPDNLLLRMDNVIATPHAAYFSSPAVAQVPRRCGEEVARALSGRRPLNVVNPEVYAPGAVRRAR
jgi:lactate dehydrogenase-like 2-hydroxyacid dehydrogenase